MHTATDDEARLSHLLSKTRKPLGISAIQRRLKWGYHRVRSALAALESAKHIAIHPLGQGWITTLVTEGEWVMFDKQRQLLENLLGQLRLLQRTNRFYQRQLSPDFSAFNFIRFDENGFSRILASLLDPHGNHAQGSSFLRLFIEHFGITESADWERAHVKTEQATSHLPDNSKRRIDIEISASGFGLGIENKLYAADQADQISDYLSHLQAKYGERHQLLYLTAETGRIPSVASISREKSQAAMEKGHLIVGSYADLVEWIDKARRACDSERVRSFLTDMILYLKKNFLGVKDMGEQNLIVDCITSSPELAEAAFKLIYSRELIEKQLIENLHTELQERLTPDGFLIELNLKDRNHFLSVFKEDWTRQKIIFGFEKIYADFFCALYSQLEGPETSILFERLSQAQSNNPDLSTSAHYESWTWYSYFRRHGVWAGNADAWTAVATGKMAEFIAEHARWLSAIAEPVLVRLPEASKPTEKP